MAETPAPNILPLAAPSCPPPDYAATSQQASIPGAAYAVQSPQAMMAAPQMYATQPVMYNYNAYPYGYGEGQQFYGAPGMPQHQMYGKSGGAVIMAAEGASAAQQAPVQAIIIQQVPGVQATADNTATVAVVSCVQIACIIFWCIFFFPVGAILCCLWCCCNN